MAEPSVPEVEEGRYLLIKEQYGGSYKIERHLTPEDITAAYARRESYTNYIVARELRPITTLQEW